MTSFLSAVLKELSGQHSDLSNLTFVLPSKRAGAFLKKEISQLLDQPAFSPGIISIEEFAENTSGLSTLDNTTTLFEFFTVYKEMTHESELEDFEKFSNWAQTLVHDFNEIDRYLVPSSQIFNYLSEIQDINHWSAQSNKTDLVENYLAFWKRLPQYYEALKASLLNKETAYQGLVYRQAVENIDSTTQANSHIFIGFNALNTAEQVMIQHMLDRGARIFWDIDEVHFNDPDHDASIFIRQYAQTWPYYQSNKFEFISSEFNTPKNIEITGIPKNIGQAKYVGELLSQMSQKELNSTALVLGDETLLLPVLSSLPPNIQALNITMGYPLQYSSFSSLFEILFQIYKNNEPTYYYKDVITVLSNPVIQRITLNGSSEVISKIREQNLLYLNSFQIAGLAPNISALIALLFPPGKLTPGAAIENLTEIIKKFKAHLTLEDDVLNLEFLFHYNSVIEKLKNLLHKYTHIRSINSLHNFYKEYISLEALDFKGKPFEGLQLMGMLESRVLDFETVILTSVDEGTLPAGKSNNSFIPYELKKKFELPTYKEKDAVYTYHFYHLLQRAKKIYLLHNIDTESRMGGEKSRFLLQLEVENQPRHIINTQVISPKVPKISTPLIRVEKTPEIIDKLKELAAKGFSPSALTTYIRNPLDFYKQYILNIRDKVEVEETIAYNTLGTVVHDTLEAFYTPLQGKQLSLEIISELQKRTAAEVKIQFEKTYSKAPLIKGKNLLIFEVAKRYVINFLKMETRAINRGEVIQIEQIETNLSCALEIPELEIPVNIKGKVDRVDIANGILRIIDYKTGKVLQNQLEIVDWDLLTTDYNKYAKPFQVLMYATMLLENTPVTSRVEAGVFSFKNLQQGFLKFGKKENSRDRNKNCDIDHSTIQNFKVELKNLILEMCDPKIPFLEKEIKTTYGNF